MKDSTRLNKTPGYLNMSTRIGSQKKVCPNCEADHMVKYKITINGRLIFWYNCDGCSSLWTEQHLDKLEEV